MNELTQEFLSHLKLPTEKAAALFVVAIVGNLGSGKSTVARKLITQIPGAVYLQGDSARFILSQHQMSWGDNVTYLIDAVATTLISRGYAVVTDASTATAEGRDRIAQRAVAWGVRYGVVRVLCDRETCRSRLREKYDDASWPSTFDRFRVNTTEKMLVNLDERSVIHEALKSSDITNLLGEINNTGAPSDLDPKIQEIADRVARHSW